MRTTVRSDVDFVITFEELQAMYVEESAGQDKKEIEGEDRDD